MFIRIYALAVCFATMMIMAISSGIALYDAVQVTVPTLTVDTWQYQNLQTNDAYRQSYLATAPIAVAPVGQPPKQQSTSEVLSEEEVTKLRERQLAIVIDGHRRDAFRSLIQSSIFFLISGVLFFVHWRLAKRLDGDED